MIVALRRVDARGTDRSALKAFLTSNTFPFHVVPRPTTAQIAENIDAGAWGDDDTQAFWIEAARDPHAGLVRLQDIHDPTVMLDLRLAERRRGHGLGTAALRAATDHLFRTRSNVFRFEGTTREDNAAMRRTFLRCGWVQEAHYRDGWPTQNGEAVASVGYSMIRRDWASGATTPVPAFSPQPPRA
jgi:RimJ/RimL family protein N-acetyltransferase